MKFLLIIIAMSLDGGVDIKTERFSSLPLCNAAAMTLGADFKTTNSSLRLGTVRAYCVETNDDDWTR